VSGPRWIDVQMGEALRLARHCGQPDASHIVWDVIAWHDDDGVPVLMHRNPDELRRLSRMVWDEALGKTRHGPSYPKSVNLKKLDRSSYAFAAALAHCREVYSEEWYEEILADLDDPHTRSLQVNVETLTVAHGQMWMLDRVPFSAPAEREQFVYRLRDVAGRLLYVGRTNHVQRRWAEHLARQPWRDEIVIRNCSWERYDSLKEAAAAEAEAIRLDQPAYNVAGAA
jgi:predicted GIY-YIG superfamily endonuclease